MSAEKADRRRDHFILLPSFPFHTEKTTQWQCAASKRKQQCNNNKPFFFNHPKYSVSLSGLLIMITLMWNGKILRLKYFFYNKVKGSRVLLVKQNEDDTNQRVENGIVCLGCLHAHLS